MPHSAGQASRTRCRRYRCAKGRRTSPCWRSLASSSPRKNSGKLGRGSRSRPANSPRRVADDEEAKVRLPIRSSSWLHLGQKGYILFHRERPQTQQSVLGPGIALAFRGMKSSASRRDGISDTPGPVCSKPHSSGWRQTGCGPWSRTLPRRPWSGPDLLPVPRIAAQQQFSSQPERRARYSCTLVCQLAASAAHVMSQPCAQHPHLAGPVM